MIVDGKALAALEFAALKNEITHVRQTPHLTVITAAPSFATQKYVALKQEQARAVGVAVDVIELPTAVTTADIVTVIARIAMQTDGIIVQLPLPLQIDVDVVLAAIPASLDVDGMQYTKTGTGFFPPVVAAIAEIAARHDVLLAGQHVVIVGHGRLVGQPAAVWARNQGARVTVITEHTPNQQTILQSADVIISGAGVPGLITPSNVREGVALFDAGTSEVGGELRGDVDPACAVKASLFTPVPGGIGPMTVAALLHNVVVAAFE